MDSVPETMNPLLEAALAGHEAGLCIIPARSDGTKAPFGAWKQYQSERPHPDDLLDWFTSRYSGMGIVCGNVSQRLECLELEGAFAFRYGELRERLDSAGLLEEWDRWLSGYAERTPGGGIHVLVRIEGEGPLPGNTKLALGPDNATWIETRGEGGFVIVAPSAGAVHPSGKPWLLKSGSFDEIAVTTLDLWDAICDVCASFDESPASEQPPEPIKYTGGARDQGGEGWIVDALAAYPSLQEVLTRHGWSYVRTEPLGQLWRRPGKDRGHSARINGSGRLINFSSSTPLGVGKRSFDAVDVDLAYELGHVPTLEQRTAALRAYKPDAPPVSVPASLAAPRATTEGAGGDDLNLPDEFWLARDYLTHVLQAGLSIMVSPDALWSAVKTFYAATIPYNFRLPGDGTLDYIGVMAGPSGSGKTRSKQEALNLLQRADGLPMIALGLPPGSGEGMTEVYLQRDKDGAQSFKLRGGGFYIDEGTWLFDNAARAGSTTIQMVKQAWSGELTGSLAATAERNRFLRPRAVRFGLLIGIQPGIAAKFLSAELADGGLPQRICWSWTQHPGLTPDPVEHPGPLDVPFFETIENSAIVEIHYCDELNALIRAEAFARATGRGSYSLNGHETLGKLKSAALHALLDGRFEVSMEDWRLASMEWEVSQRVQSHISATHRASAADSARARGVAEAEAGEARFDYGCRLAAEALVRAIRDKLKRPLTKREAQNRLGSYRARYGVYLDDVIEFGERFRLLRHTEDGGVDVA